MSKVEKLELRDVPVAQLSVFHRNPRRGNVKAIAESLATRGQYKPLVVNLGTLTGRAWEILAGNHTFQAAVSLGWESVQVVVVDVDDAGAAQIVAADNRIADLGSYDDEDLLAVLEAAGDLAGTGYSDVDFAALARSLDVPVALTDPDEVPALPEDRPVSLPGDVWELGPHRLYVGSSGDTDAVLAVAQGVVDCVWTDPPYGVEYVGKTSDKMTIQNDGRDSALQVLKDALVTIVAVARPGAPVYMAHADVLRVPFQLACEDAGLRLRQTLIWVKDRMVLSRADYHYKTEPILHGEVGGAPAVPDEDYEPIGYGFAPGGEGRLGRGGPHWHGPNNATTVFEVARPKAAREHPTMKPVELIEPMLRNSCPPGGLVFDAFGGSGSTMIAAHRAGMRSLLVELDPRYADVICRRWEEHTGVIPVRDGRQVSFVGGDRG